MKNIILKLAAATVLLGIIQPAYSDYQITYLGRQISDNERLVDSSRNGWAILDDLNTDSECQYLVNINLKKKINLCDKGIRDARAVNRHGDVAGLNKRKEVAVWNHNGGIKTYKTAGKINNIEIVDLNDSGQVLAGSAGYDEDNYVIRAYFWKDHKTFKEIKIEDSEDVQALALNDKGQVIVRADRNIYLRNESGKLKKLPYSDANYGEFSMNNSAQIASSSSYEAILTQGKGWKEIVQYTPYSCSRCDTGGFSDISESGKAIFYSGHSATLAENGYAVDLNCFMPQNQTIINSDSRISNFNTYSTEKAAFLDEDKILVNMDIADGDNSYQLFLMEKKKGSENRITNYCLKTDVEKDTGNGKGCDMAENTGPANCSGKVTLSALDSYLPPMTIEISAIENDFNYQTCPANFVNNFEIAGSSAAGSFSFLRDPGFVYHLKLTDPRFILMESILTPYAFQFESYIEPCRKPLEGIPDYN